MICDSQNRQAFLHPFTLLYLPYYHMDLFNSSTFIPHIKPEVKIPLQGQVRDTFSKNFKNLSHDSMLIPINVLGGAEFSSSKPAEQVGKRGDTAEDH